MTHLPLNGFTMATSASQVSWEPRCLLEEPRPQVETLAEKESEISWGGGLFLSFSASQYKKEIQKLVGMSAT